MDWDELKTRWQAHRGHLEHHWQRISEREFDEIAGDRQRLSRRIQEVYRVSPEEAEREIAAWEMEHVNFDPSSADGPPPVPSGALARNSEGAASAPGAERLVDTGTYPQQPRDGAAGHGAAKPGFEPGASEDDAVPEDAGNALLSERQRSAGYMDDESAPELNEHAPDAPGATRPRNPAR